MEFLSSERYQPLDKSNRYSACRISFANYIYETYGFTVLQAINKDWTSIKYDKKIFDDLVSEWQNYLDGLLK